MIRASAQVVTHAEPHVHHTGLHLIDAEDLRRLNAEPPAMSEFIRAVKEAPEFDKHYRLWLMTVHQEGRHTPKAEKLPPAWAELLDEVVQDSFRTWLSSRTGVDLEGAALEVNVSLRDPGDYRNVHRGKPDRAMNAVLVLSEHWPETGGGTYDLWESPDRDAPARSVLPVPGSLYTVVPSDASWHSVSPVAQDAPGSLLTLALGYSMPERRS
ncbi:hypothetical protein ACGFNQ_12425 [Streptomyces asoensis]|uniref:hypothetical protein n=1 Tax=Streptomyces asoensis TaxID=249586 RepID=UPI00371DB25D